MTQQEQQQITGALRKVREAAKQCRHESLPHATMPYTRWCVTCSQIDRQIDAALALLKSQAPAEQQPCCIYYEDPQCFREAVGEAASAIGYEGPWPPEDARVDIVRKLIAMVPEYAEQPSPERTPCECRKALEEIAANEWTCYAHTGDDHVDCAVSIARAALSAPCSGVTTDEMTREITRLANEAYLAATQSGMPGAVIAQALTQHGQSEYERGRREAAEQLVRYVDGYWPNAKSWRRAHAEFRRLATDIRSEFGLSEKGEAR